MSKRTKVLFLPPAEFGQANIVLAMTSELLKREAIDVHIASFSGLAKRVQQLQPDMQPPSNPSASTLTFHLLDGLTHTDALYRYLDADKSKVPPAISGDFSPYRHLGDTLAPWPEEEYMSLVDQYKRLIRELEPDSIVLDMIMAPSIDACRSLNRRYVLASPLPGLLVSMDPQGMIKQLFCYPA